MGGVDYRVIMPWVFKESAVNLNFTIPNIRTGIPLRVWDVLGARGFLFTNHQAELDNFFRDGEDMVWFDCEDELYDKADFYLDEKNASLRDQISQRGYEKVGAYHTFDQRIAQILAEI
jgi:spore maturation protein CgeB